MDRNFVFPIHEHNTANKPNINLSLFCIAPEKCELEGFRLNTSKKWESYFIPFLTFFLLFSGHSPFGGLERVDFNR